ncbi:TorF family putative porin [bacterium]|nr:TorF family putative porin [bacterium]MBU1958098.1 TorF family putative porin [bacterium]
MKFTKLSLIAAVAVSAISTAAVATEVEVSSNAGAVSNYVWRGMTQTGNAAAIQGGIDFTYGGLYAGTWASNVDFGSAATAEVDGYVGYAGEVAGIEYDLGYIKFGYVNESDINFDEVYFGLSKDFGVASLGATYSKGVNDGYELSDIAVEASVALPKDYSLDLGWGDYEDYGTRYSVGASKSFDKVDFSLAYSDYSADAGSASDEKIVVVGVSTGF